MKRSKRRALLAILLLTTMAPGVARAQLTIDQRGLEVRLWRAGGEATRVALPSHLAPSTAVEAEDGFVLAGTDRRTGTLFVARHEDGTRVDLPTPRRREGQGQFRPTLLTSGSRLEAMAWLEGTWEQEAAIHVAAWNGTSWESVEVVSGRSRAPQLAVTGAVLSDDSWLLLWAGFDGSDDEIWWSRRVDEHWSRPRRLHSNNAVPDILPTVVETENGALAAWSFYDGEHYRVRTARWDGEEWRPGPVLAGRGALEARWQRLDQRRFLTYRTVEPEAWGLAEGEDGGRVRGRLVDSLFDERPLVVLKGSAARLRWPWRQGSAER